MLRIKLLAAGAKAPSASQPGTKVAYDLYALSTTKFAPLSAPAHVRTGVAVEAFIYPSDSVNGGNLTNTRRAAGLLVLSHPSLVAKGLRVIDMFIEPNNPSEIILTIVPLNLITTTSASVTIASGDPIAQIYPVAPLSDAPVEIVTAF